MPNYNYASFIGRSVESVLAQPFTDFELIIVDDASCDDSVSVIEGFSDSRIRFYRNEKNIGRLKNINKCISLARGEYVTILPSDEVYTADSLAQRVRILDEHPEVGLVFSAAEYIDTNGNRVKEYQPFDGDWVRSGEEVFKTLILGNYIVVPTAMARRECFLALGSFNEGVATGSRDWDMWLRIALDDRSFGYIDTKTVCARYHGRDAGLYYDRTNIRGMNHYMIIRHIFSNLPPGKTHLSYLEPCAIDALAQRMLAQAQIHMKAGDCELARKNVGLAVAVKGGLIKSWKIWAYFFISSPRNLRLVKSLPRSMKKSISETFLNI